MSRLADLLEDRGFTQGDLAEATGLHRTHINSIVNGRKTPALETARKIATALGMAIEDIWPGGEDKEA